MADTSGMNLENRTLEEVTNINFPRDINEREIMDVLKYVAAHLGTYSKVDGNFSGHIFINPNQTEKYVGRVDGLISRLKNDQLTSVDFSFCRSKIDLLGKFSGLKFELIPGYDTPDEIDENAIKLYDDVKEIVNAYFKSGPELEKDLVADLDEARE